MIGTGQLYCIAQASAIIAKATLPPLTSASLTRDIGEIPGAGGRLGFIYLFILFLFFARNTAMM